MASKDRAEDSWLFSRIRIPGAVVEQHGGKRTPASRPPEQAAQRETAALNHNGLGCNHRLTLRANRDSRHQSQPEHERSKVSHTSAEAHCSA